MKRILKKNYKLILGVIIGIAISGVGVYATNILSSSEVSYDNSKSGGTSSNVQGSIEELYEKVNSCSQESNENILVAYTYDQTSGSSNFCVTGEEATCKKTTCYKNKTKGSCKAGTIIKYKVNDREEKYFHVIHDDGETMTLQQRENTVYNVVWYSSSNDNTKGPLTILPALESATSGWINVENQTYQMGITNFNNTNAYTGCHDYNSCTTNKYKLESRTAKARMITIQETNALGCTTTEKSCPKFMNNYLHDSISNGGTVNDTHTENGASYNNGYWTMSAYSSNSSYAWYANYSGLVNNRSVNTIVNCGARAVVVVYK